MKDKKIIVQYNESEQLELTRLELADMLNAMLQLTIDTRKVIAAGMELTIKFV